MEKETVLLVDDDLDTLEFLGIYLETAGHSVVAYSNGFDALDAVEASLPALIVSDVRMPGMTGYQLCRKVRESGLVDVPFIFCSALDAPPERTLGLRLGADDYIVKPVNPEELLLRVETLLARNRRLKSLEQNIFRESDALLEGRTGELSVTDLLQLSSLMGPGELRLEVVAEDSARGSAYLRAGRLLHVETEGASGASALPGFLTLTGGSFRLERAGFDGRPTIDRSLDACLLEAMVLVDESRRLERKARSALQTLQDTV